MKTKATAGSMGDQSVRGTTRRSVTGVASITLSVKVWNAKDAKTFGVQVGDEVTLELFGGVYHDGQRVAGVATACCLLKTGGAVKTTDRKET